MRVLAGDIGGTNARLAIYDVEDERYELESSETYPSQRFDSLAAIVRAFVSDRETEVQRACFGVPGPVKGRRAQTTNLPWLVRAAELAASVGVDQVAVINDLEAQAHGIVTLASDDLVTLNAGDPRALGNRALIAAGTGLGQAGLFWDGENHHPFACEGGHTSFAPRGVVQTALLEYLSERFEHVSWERVVSGPGLVSLHDFLVEHRRFKLPADHDVPDPEAPEAITESAMAGRCPVCVEALELFVQLYGAEAGNLALKIMARGGLYIGGGIAPKIIEVLKEPPFIEAFLAKGRMRPLLEAMPVRVILNERTALQGAARFAAKLLAR